MTWRNSIVVSVQNTDVDIGARSAQFRAEHEDITELRPVKRLDAEPVADKGERTLLSKRLPFPAHLPGGKDCRIETRASGALEPDLAR
jgi:hypothetical protein